MALVLTTKEVQTIRTNQNRGCKEAQAIYCHSEVSLQCDNVQVVASHKGKNEAMKKLEAQRGRSLFSNGPLTLKRRDKFVYSTRTKKRFCILWEILSLFYWLVSITTSFSVTVANAF